MDTALIVRLRRMGTKRKPHHQIVVAEASKSLSGRVVEHLGYFDPSKEPEFVKLNLERLDYWVGRGAKVTDRIGSIAKRVRKSQAAGPAAK